MVRQQSETLLVRLFIRDASFIKKLLAVREEHYYHELMDDEERQELRDRVFRLGRHLLH